MNRRVTALTIALIALALPLAAHAASFRTGDRSYTLPKSETLSRDLFAASGTVTIHGTVHGDLFVAGGDVRVDGEVTGDVFATGGSVTIAGRVGESVRVAGGDVTLEGQVGRNVSLVGGSLTTTSDSTIAGDLDLAGGSVSLSGTSGPTQIASGSVEIHDTARINGSLEYTSDRGATVASGAVISGKTIHHTPAKHTHRGWAGLGFKLFWLLSVLVTALIFLWAFPRKSALLAADWRSRPIVLLYGLLGLIAIPILAILLFITFLGAPLGIVTLLTYGILLYLAAVVSVIVVGDWVTRLADKKAVERVSWTAPFIGAAVLLLIGLIPFVGWLANLLIWLGALGALLRFDLNYYRSKRGTEL